MKEQVKTLIKAMAHKTPGLTFVEIGAGTGGLTSVILDALKYDEKYEPAVRLFDEYVYTDISSSFFLKAKENFLDSRLIYKTLDISSKPADQGIDVASFDVVAASNVLHATSDIVQTLRNCRSLLKPNGKLIIHEYMDPNSVNLGFIFGLFKGWWSAKEESRHWSPLMSQDQWNELLRNTGFSGAELALKGDPTKPAPSPMVAVLVSTAVAAIPSIKPLLSQAPVIYVLYENSSRTQNHVFEHLCHQQTMSGLSINLVPLNLELAASTDLANSKCIFLPSLDGFSLDELNDKHLSYLKNLCCKSRGILWISTKSKDSRIRPSHALATGLARTIESENLDFSFITLTAESPVDPTQLANHIWKILNTNPTRSEDGYENEYVEHDGILCIPRIVEAPHVTAQIYANQHEHQSISRPWKQESGKPIKLAIEKVGFLDSLVFEEFELSSAGLAPGDVEVDVLAFGLNFRDILTALGKATDLYLGDELVGIVTALGSDTNPLSIGDVVVGLHTGTMASKVRCKNYQLHKLPAGVPFRTAAAIPLVFCTAYYSLVTWARAQPGETVLIHSGAGGVGQAAIQLAKLLGLTIFTTTSNEEKSQLLTDLYGIPKSHIFSSRSLDFSLGIKRMTGGLGVDIVLNSLSGEGLRKSWEVIAPFGRFIEIGLGDVKSPGVSGGGLPMRLFEKNVMFASVNLPTLYRTKDRISDVLAAVVDLLAEGKISPPNPVQAFKVSEIEQSFRLMQSGYHMGKLVMEIADKDVVKATKFKKTQVFNADATYVIAGGLGGIGRRICDWMITKGARNIAILSRSGVRDSETESFLDKLRSRGANVLTYHCDVSVASQLQSVLESIGTAMPPIKGCVQAAMVLRVSKHFSAIFFQY